MGYTFPNATRPLSAPPAKRRPGRPITSTHPRAAYWRERARMKRRREIERDVLTKITEMKP